MKWIIFEKRKKTVHLDHIVDFYVSGDLLYFKTRANPYTGFPDGSYDEWSVRYMTRKEAEEDYCILVKGLKTGECNYVEIGANEVVREYSLSEELPL